MSEGPKLAILKNRLTIQYTLDLRKPGLRKNLDLRKIVATTDFLVHKLFHLRKISKNVKKKELLDNLRAILEKKGFKTISPHFLFFLFKGLGIPLRGLLRCFARTLGLIEVAGMYLFYLRS